MITALLTALSKTLRSCVWASLTHNAAWQDAGITVDKIQYCEAVIQLVDLRERFSQCHDPVTRRKLITQHFSLSGRLTCSSRVVSPNDHSLHLAFQQELSNHNWAQQVIKG